MYRERLAKSVTPKSIALTDRFRQTPQGNIRFDMGAAILPQNASAIWDWELL